MSALLSGLRHPRARGYEKTYPQGYSPFAAYNDALDDVETALRSDRTKRAIAADLCEHEGVDKACIDCTYKAESVQELLAGGDQ